MRHMLRKYFNLCIIVTNLTFLTNGNRGKRFSLVIFENIFVTVMKKTKLFTKCIVFDHKYVLRLCPIKLRWYTTRILKHFAQEIDKTLKVSQEVMVDELIKWSLSASKRGDYEEAESSRFKSYKSKYSSIS